MLGLTKVDPIFGNIAEQIADVMVNTTQQDLDLKVGAVSSAILLKAGAAMQEECRRNYPRGIQEGDMVVTRGHGLQCRDVFHLVLPPWSEGRKSLKGMVTKCLTSANSKNYASIVFPALGTGVKGYPADKTARLMLEAMTEFQRSNPSTSLRDVKVVVYDKDTAVMQAFKTEFSRVSSSSRPLTTTVDNKPNSSRVRFELGDIAELQADVIVNTTQTDLILSCGAVSSSILRKAGQSLQDECRIRYPAGIQIGSIAYTKNHGLRCRYIFHLALPDWSAKSGAKKLKIMITKCLTKASEKGFSFLVFPALGTGNKGYPRTETARAMLDSIDDFFTSKPDTSINDVRVVVYHGDDETVRKFSAVFRPGTGFEKKAAHVPLDEHARSREDREFTAQFSLPPLPAETDGGKQLNPTVSPAPLSSIDLFIYAESESSIRKVLDILAKKATVLFPTITFDENLLTSMEQREVRRIHEICEADNVDVTLDIQKHQIQLFGHIGDVQKAQKKITDVFQKAAEMKHKREMEDYIANVVQWCFLEVTSTGRCPKPYGKPQNKLTEEAFRKKEQSVELKDVQGNVYVINFEQMVEYPKDDESDKVYVIRREKTEGDEGSVALPKTWLPMRTDENLKIVPLKPTEQEYVDVLEHFLRNLDIGVTLVSIDRIQNKLLMSHYTSKKSHMAKQNGRDLNERILWHGTDSEATQSINQDGFNRSYCGKNATAFGQGVYFAVSASYSAQSIYSPPDAAGKRYIYQCRVLTGRATRGQSSMMYLPKLRGDINYDSATDHVQSPSMYVIFSDTQAYPEYLITFKRK